MAAHLRENGVNDEQIIEINFESYEFIKMTSDDLYQYVKERSLPGKRMYLFFDELQRMAGWENTINAFRVDLDCDIYITGSNAKLLSGELATYLGGRYVEFVIYPFSFGEFMELTVRLRLMRPSSSVSKSTCLPEGCPISQISDMRMRRPSNIFTICSTLSSSRTS